MNSLRPTLLCLLSLAQGVGWDVLAGTDAPPVEREINAWPFLVEKRAAPAANVASWHAAGPLMFGEQSVQPDGGTVSGFRPFWVQTKDAQGSLRSGHSLYPLFTYTQDDTSYKWSLFELIQRQGRRAGSPLPAEEFDPRHELVIFPFWFEREFADPANNYRAFFPFHGTVRQKLWLERASWTLFPFFVENERRGAVTTYTPWPFVRVTRGTAQGWGVWPFFSTIEHPGEFSATYYLWPLIYDRTRQPTPDDPPGTPARRDMGVLPFYARSTGPGYVDESYLWPFLGYTDRDSPRRYSERRYLWPLFMQARSEDRYVNRWAPFYSHSTIKGYDKQWFAWPLLRHAQWTEEGVERTRSQFLYFVVWHEQQRIAGRRQSPTAALTHFWPLFSNWDNGAGRRQWQLFSPLEVFFPFNPKVRQAWSPLFALARHDERPDGGSRTSLLWNAMTWEKRPAENHREFHLGPLLGITRTGPEQRVSVGSGLFGFQRAADGSWRTFWFDFPRRASRAASAPADSALSP